MYSRPASPRPTRSPVRGVASLPASQPQPSQPSQPPQASDEMVRRMPQPAPLQAQGRSVTSQNGQRGVVGRGGNFQALGDAALNRLGAGGGAVAGSGQWRGGSSAVPDVEAAVNGAGGVGGDIQTAIQGLKSQLGMPADADAATRMSGFGPNVQSMGPALQTALAGANGGNPNSAPGMPPDVAGRLRAMTGIGAPKSGPVPYFGGDEMSLGRNGGVGRGGAGFMPGQANPYAEILRQRLGAGGGGGMAGQYAY